MHEIQSVTFQMKATKQHFPVALFMLLRKILQAFESVEGILKCGSSNENYWAVLFNSVWSC